MMRAALLVSGIAVTTFAAADAQYDAELKVCQDRPYIAAEYRDCWERANKGQRERDDPSLATDMYWQRDERYCKEGFSGGNAERYCLDRATENRGLRIQEAKRGDKDAEFDHAYSECLKLNSDQFKGCYINAAREREKRAQVRTTALAEARDAKAAVRAAEQRKAAAATAPQRARLADEYQRLLVLLYPRHNFIKIRTAAIGDKFALYGRHSCFNRFSFDLGDQGPTVSRWVGERHVALRAAGILRVGVEGDDGEGTFFTIK